MTLRCTGTLHVVQNEETIKNLHDILAEGHGCLLVSAHFGSWQVGLLGLEQLGRPIHIVQWTKNGDIDPHYFQGTHMQHDIHIIDPAQGLSAIVQIYNALRHNDIVCMMGDRLRDYEKEYTTVNFLGDSIRIPNAPWVIASQTSSPVLHTFSIRKHGVVTGLPPLLVRVPSGIRKSPELLKTLILRFTGHLEMLTAEYPCDFFNFYDMWSTEDDQV
jgi:predicted LPLAT superfamily acyltransferase